MSLTKSLHWSDFYPTTPCTQTFKSRQQADVVFNLGAADRSNRTNLLPFSNVTVASEETCDHALSNRRRATAQGRTQYAYEIIFYNRSKEIQIARGTVSIAVPSTLHLSPSHSAQELSHSLKRPKCAKSRFKSLRHTSDLPFEMQVNLDEHLGESVYDQPPTENSSTISIPFTLDLAPSDSMPPNISELIDSGATCNTQAKWYIYRTVGKPSRNNIEGISKSFAVSVKATSAIPPLYSSNQTSSYTAKQHFSAASSIELELPHTALIPSIEIPGLSIQYELELRLAITATSTSSCSSVASSTDLAQPLAETTFRMPVILSAG